MDACERLLAYLQQRPLPELPTELQAHVAGCSGCRHTLERRRELDDAARIVAEAPVPSRLLARLKAIPGGASACDGVHRQLPDALDGTLSPDEANRFLDHLQGCDTCRRVWESMATLREIGAVVRAPRSLVARAAVPPWRRLDLRRRTRFIPDLRLATAAAYLLAALAVFLVGNPTTLARDGSASFEKATIYARAAVSNRVDSLADRARRTASDAGDWVVQKARLAWDEVEGWFGKNPNEQDNVDTGDDGRFS